MKKFYRGKIVKITAGAIQFVRNNEKKRDFLLLTSRDGDVYIPLSAVEKALEDQWIADQELRSHRINEASKCCGKYDDFHVQPKGMCETCRNERSI